MVEVYKRNHKKLTLFSHEWVRVVMWRWLPQGGWGTRRTGRRWRWRIASVHVRAISTRFCKWRQFGGSLANHEVSRSRDLKKPCRSR